ncbi:DivIVA domain-containing protein [Microbacterium gorillae]|uniref:DivIVA domain-containing protein n=1 Tax=Microbacterium gorillae TaxID=1231063 RepID=UPI00058D2ECB|nr:DivIVA domain-containing protein [Microbacterium gorillae]
MALTPDDVVTKQFQHVRFKEGFDPDEVDDFLDEIVVEWRKTIEENTELKAKLAAYESGEKPAEAAAPAAEPEAAKPEPEAAKPEPEAAPLAAPVAAGEPQGAAASAGIIELAQRLHDEHVAEGKTQRDRLIADAEKQAKKIVDDAEEKSRVETKRLDDERQVLEGRITELRGFERDYRANLRKYIEGQLKDLDQSGTASGNTPVSAIGL